MAAFESMTVGSDLAQRLNANLADFEQALETFFASVPLSKSWIDREWPLSQANLASSLLIGAKIALLEAGTAWAVGANRGAAASLRVYIENLFAWLYYKDHRIEFQAVQLHQSDLILPKATQTFLKNYLPGFEKAYSILSKSAQRSDEYYYTVVSSYVHAHPSFAAISKPIDEIAVSSPRDAGFLKLASAADEFISDNFLSLYRSSWDDVPGTVRADATVRLGDKVAKLLEA